MKTARVEEIGSEVRRAFASHPITWERIRSKQIAEDVFAARLEAARMLRGFGLKHAEIGAVINRSRPAVCQMLRPKWAKVGK